MAGPRVVFDTNVFVRALINPKGINARLVASFDRYVLISSSAIIAEVADVLFRPEVLGVTALRKLDAQGSVGGAPRSVAKSAPPAKAKSGARMAKRIEAVVRRLRPANERKGGSGSELL